MTRRTYLIILAIGAALRLLLIWNAGLWYDENFSLLLSRLPFLRMLAATMGDVHPPLFYLLIWPLGRIPDLPAWAIRLPSAVLSIGSLALYPRLMRDLHIPDRVQLVAFVMMAILPMQIHYAQEGRMYALLELLAILGVLVIIEGRPVLLAVAVAGLLYSQNYGAFYVAALGGLLLMVIYRQWDQHRLLMMDLHGSGFDIPIQFRATRAMAMQIITQFDSIHRRNMRRRWFRLAAAMLIGVLAWLPWLPVILRQMNFIQSNYWIFDINTGAVLYLFFHLFWAYSLQTPAGNLAGMLITFGVLILALWYLLARRPASWLIVLWLAAAPVLLALIVSLIAQPILLFRPLIGVTPFLYIACAYPLSRLSGLRAHLLAACFILPLLIMAIPGYYFYLPRQKTLDGSGNMQAAIELIRSQWRPGDLILDGNGMGWVSLSPYLDLPQYALPNCAERFPGGISPATHDALGIRSLDLADLPPHKRIWFVGVISPMGPGCEIDRIDAITAGHAPYLVLDKSEFLLSAVWLLEGN